MNDTYDVIVVGGGPAGIGAAIASARNGLSVLLLEKMNCVGEMLTNGLVNMIRTAGDGGGIVREVWRKLASEGCAEITDTDAWINPFAARVTYLDMLEESEVDLLLHTHLAGVVSSDRTVSGIWFANKDGLHSVSCGIAVDATGDGDVAFLSFAPCQKGREDGHLQAVSLNFFLAGIDEDLLPAREEFRTVCSEALDSGRIQLPPPARSLHLGHSGYGYPKGIRQFQYDMAEHIDGSDAESLTEGERLCHRRVFAIWQFLKSTFPAYEHSIIIDVASHLGIRETRRVIGMKTLTEEMVLGAAKQQDTVSRRSWYMDLHDGQDKHPLHLYRAARRPPEGNCYEIPYGCLYPESVGNLPIAGRSISSTRAANGSLRLQPTCMNVGQAAGTAAALCVGRSCSSSSLDGIEVRARLTEQVMEL